MTSKLSKFQTSHPVGRSFSSFGTLDTFLARGNFFPQICRSGVTSSPYDTSEVFAQRNTADQANLQLLQPSSTSTQPWYLRQGECILCMEPLLPGSTFGFRCGHYCMCSCYQQDPRSIQDGSAKRNCQVPGCHAQ